MADSAMLPRIFSIFNRVGTEVHEADEGVEGSFAAGARCVVKVSANEQALSVGHQLCIACCICK